MSAPSDAGKRWKVADLGGLAPGFEGLFQAAPSPFLVIIPPDYAIIAVNDEYLSATMTEREAIVGRTVFEVFPDNPGSPVAAGPRELRASLARVMSERRTDDMPVARYDIQRPAARGGGFEERWWASRNAPILGPDGEVLCIIYHVIDVTARVHAEAALRQVQLERSLWLRGHGEALTAAVNGAPLARCLEPLVRAATETLGEGTRAAFHLADREGTGLHHAVGMPEEYAQAVDGSALGPESLACGLAAQTGDPVLTVDVQTDPRWEPWRFLAERFDYRGCWSFPIRSVAGVLVGTLVFYWREPRAATERELQLASLLTNTAAIIIARYREVEVRRQAEEALRGSLAEREALLHELHHRVKNNLQVVTSLLEMQGRQDGGSKAKNPLFEARDRIHAIAAIHELLYQSGSLSEVDLPEYARRLVRHVGSLYDVPSRIDASVTGDDMKVAIGRAVPFGLLLHELVSNAYKHAFPSGSGGEVRVEFQQADGHVVLRVRDTGVGLTNGAQHKPSTLGLQLVRMLAKQLGGRVTFEAGPGTNIEVRVLNDGSAG